ncbi:L-ascorbate metabolism protein UlaG (beta-lactamase superfamily) [Paenibacillus rhizosphaerae]|uniref:L-ascorbate metabolism protein UlaG (Beta-lactamase superfamily) n=1 Tax=Paenibacillus rhizosphaerae TaxID=297318 RepID=A0A839TMI3_9BACL|nr:MBL fold metallo-hydrolase [Paenibacillus rhizosphaerae]MBB3126940.1 L-ascorbate metabolism protein UlaG (beta-lactamase superfamily) [Paenibacillus rhizosphaerae]
MKIQLIRNATLFIEYAGVTLLVDPMFSEQGANPPVINTANELRNPLVPLPVEVEKLVQPDALLVTHRHPDHWDEPAQKQIAKDTAVFCQPEDEGPIRAAGFSHTTPVEQAVTFRGITLIRTGGHHGTGEIGKQMGPVCGFVLQAEGQPTVYIAGDTIWCREVEEALDAYHPDLTIVNAGGARFLTGAPIIMDEKDVIAVLRHEPETRVAAVHMEAINHCFVTREDLRSAVEKADYSSRVVIPEDGEVFTE